MYRCIHISSGSLTESLLNYFIRRTICIELRWDGPLSEEVISVLRSEIYDLVFVSLPPPDEILPEDILTELRRQQSLILSSFYPKHLYFNYQLKPVCFLTEPFSVHDFQLAIEKHLFNVYPDLGPPLLKGISKKPI
jgi:hypothetical protein